MNYSTAVMLINTNIRAVDVAYDDDTPGRKHRARCSKPSMLISHPAISSSSQPRRIIAADLPPGA